jgi:sec-independent protein translocase protein TatA
VLTPVETGFSGHTGKGVASLFGIGSQELLIIFLVVLLLFGADRIPEVARAIGKSIREFKRAAGEIETEIQQVTREKDILTGKREARPDRHKPEPGDAEPPPRIRPRRRPTPRAVPRRQKTSRYWNLGRGQVFTK